MDLNILLTKSKTDILKTRRDDLEEFCRMHCLTVNSTGKRGQAIKPDFVIAICAYVSEHPKTYSYTCTYGTHRWGLFQEATIR